MRRIKKGDTVRIVKPLCVRRYNGKIENYKDKIVKVKKVSLSKCSCDLGLEHLINIPISHLKRIA